MRITVTGTSRISLPAECVAVNLTLGFTGPDRDSVVADTASVTDRTRGRLEAAASTGTVRDIKLTSLRTWTSTPLNTRGQPQPPQHTAEVRGSFLVLELSALGELLGELAATPGVQVGWLDWRLRESTMAEVQPRALADAFDDAHRRAEWISTAARRGGVEAVAIQDQGGGIAPVAFARKASREMMMDSAPSIDLDPQDVEISVSLTVEFTAA
ncbi:SIMPL domain-containing protein [Tessaracoccus sp. G1721]